MAGVEEPKSPLEERPPVLPPMHGGSAPVPSSGGARGEPPADLRGAVPQSQIREDSVSVFDKKAGDTSRSLVIIILVAAALLLLGVMFLTEAPTP